MAVCRCTGCTVYRKEPWRAVWRFEPQRRRGTEKNFILLVAPAVPLTNKLSASAVQKFFCRKNNFR